MTIINIRAPKKHRRIGWVFCSAFESMFFVLLSWSREIFVIIQLLIHHRTISGDSERAGGREVGREGRCKRSLCVSFRFISNTHDYDYRAGWSLCLSRLGPIFHMLYSKNSFGSFTLCRTHDAHQNWSLFSVNYIMIDCDREMCVLSVDACAQCAVRAFL